MTKKTFAGIDIAFATEDAEIWLQGIPYDGTSTWGKGADKGLQAFLDAADNLELYDIETDTEVYKKGIHLLPEILESKSPRSLFETVYSTTSQLLTQNKFLTFFGGEHSISIGIIKAFYERFDDITVLQLDAHADLRPSYEGSAYNHACAMFDACKNTNLVQVGIRSMDESEKEVMQPGNVFFAHELFEGWIDSVISRCTDHVYLTLDLDVLDPSIMPATGTPEPGGLTWQQITTLCRSLFKQRNVLGLDIVELAPVPGLHHPQFLAAKLYYKLLSYKFESTRK